MQEEASHRQSSKHLKACLGPASVTVLHRRGPLLALRPLQFCTGGAPFGTLSVTVLHRRGPPLAFRPLQFCIGGGPLWHSVRYGFASEGTPLALRPLQFCIGGGPLWHSVRPVWDLRPLQFCIGGDPFGTPSVTVLHRWGPLWHSEIFKTPGHVTARRSILGPPAEGRPGPSLVQKITRMP